MTKEGHDLSSFKSILPPSKPDDPWHLAYEELKAMGHRMSQLDAIKRDMTSLTSQVGSVVGRTKALEGAVHSHTQDLKALSKDVKEVNEQQETSLDHLWQYTEEIATYTDNRFTEVANMIASCRSKLNDVADIKEELTKEMRQELQQSVQTLRQEMQQSSQGIRQEMAVAFHNNT